MEESRGKPRESHQIECVITVRPAGSTAVVRLVSSRSGRRVVGRSRSVGLGMGSDQLAGLSLSSALYYLGQALVSAGKQSRGQPVPERPLDGGTPGAPEGATGGALEGQLELPLAL